MAAGDVDDRVAGDIAAQRTRPVGKRAFAVEVYRHRRRSRKRKQRCEKTAFGLLHLRFQLQDILIRKEGDVGIDLRIRRIEPMGGER